ncbi:MAG: hypothetical protein Q4B48_01120, partial [Syntrophomonadaceae bacterium]|nr:hypothetical protein [Syntrophomonadaceae bacterium]
MVKAKRKLLISVILLLCAGLLVILQINYPITRQSLERLVATQSSALQTRNFLSQYSEHFIIKYLPIDEKYVEIILRGSEQSYDDVVQWFGTDGPVPAPELIVFPTAASLASSFGWDRNQQSMGVYWGGSIRILSPAEWMDEPSLEEFCREGPMVHELCHLMVDEVSGGNYSRWFTEGLAQYLEKQINGFAFPQPEMTADDIMGFAEMG